MKRAVVLFLLLSIVQTYAQNDPVQVVPKYSIQSKIKIDFLPAGMPEGESDMGLAGIHYNFYPNEWFYTGLGMYGAVSGERGGLFMMGLDLGINKSLYKGLFFDAGFQFGGGGGAGAPDGGGAYILPHLNLGYAFKKFSVEAGYSYINFFDGGKINSSQWNVAVQIPLSFKYTSFKYTETNLEGSEISFQDQWQQKSHRLSVMFHFNNYDLIGDTKDTDGLPMDDKIINTVGIEMNSYMKNNSFFFIKADGAYNGIESGYMDIILGLGYDFSFNKDRTRILGKFGIGAAGGGGVDTGGGFVLYPDISIEQKLFNSIFISLNKGMLLSPDTKFISSSFGLGLKYYLNQNGLTAKNGDLYTKAKFKGKEIILGEEYYFNVARTHDGLQKDMQQIAFQLNFYLKEFFYLSGQVSFANFGDAGAYAEGLVGGGFNTTGNFSRRFQLFAQVLFGAAGGGWIDTGEGVIIKPGIGASVFFNEFLGLRITAGQAKALGGELNSTFINASVSYRFALLKAR